MKQVIVEQFGGLDVLQVRELPTPEPGAGQVRVKITSIGMNHADLMARQGQYRLSSGDPPFTPGIEGGGIIDAVGAGVTQRKVGQRVSLSPDAPRHCASGGSGSGGTYRSHYVAGWQQTIPVPDAIPDNQIGALWLPYLTAWGCLVWKQNLRAGQIVALPACTSSVALAAGQIAKKIGAKVIGLTTSAGKVERLKALPTCAYDHVVVTREPDGTDRPWYRDFKDLTAGKGVDVFFDPVAAGAYLDSEIRSLGQYGTIWVYGLLGQPGKVDVTPLIRKFAAIRGWALTELVQTGGPAVEQGCRHILDGFADGSYRQHVDRQFKLDQVREAQEYMEQGKHIGKLVMTP